MRMSSKKGFSLVELIIVIAILGIIAVIAVPNFVGIQKSSQLQADIRSAEQIASSITTWLAEGSLSERNNKQDFLSSRTAKLSDLTTTKFAALTGADAKYKNIKGIETIISAEYVPGSRVTDGGSDPSNPITESGVYYVTYRKDKVVVAVYGTTATAEDIHNMATCPKIFSINANEDVVSGVACIRGIAELSVDNVKAALGIS